MTSQITAWNVARLQDQTRDEVMAELWERIRTLLSQAPARVVVDVLVPDEVWHVRME